MLLGLPHLEPFTGEGTEPFSHWLRRFNDHAEAHEKPWTDADKLRKLKAYLRGGPREKWDEFRDTEKATFAAATTKLKSVYENSYSKDIAKLNLARCHQRAGESINDFVERLRKHVKAATVGSRTDCFKERFLEEFLDRLDDKIGFHVKAIMPQNMEEAVCQAMHFEGLLEARKMKRSAEDEADEIAACVVAALKLSGHRDEPTKPLARRIQCHNCGEWGHIRRDCHIHDQGWYDKRSYDDCQRSNNTGMMGITAHHMIAAM
ncbi:Protein DCT-10 [Aphelenchoides avenae]|nr:Protein DCT-10 [Aphelenchus avenae]